MFRESYSKEMPLAAENVGNGRYIIRRNIRPCIDADGNTSYSYEEKVVSKDAYDVMQSLEGVELKREAVIIDEYTMRLIEEGSL